MKSDCVSHQCRFMQVYYNESLNSMVGQQCAFVNQKMAIG